MADLTLPQLLAQPSKDLVREQIFGHLNGDGFPVTDFEEGAIVRTIAEATAEVIANHVANMRPKIASAGFSQEAAGDWLTLKARQDYQLERAPATTTVQLIRLAAAAGVGPYPLSAGDLVVEATSGNRYTLDESGEIPVGTGIGLFGEASTDFVELRFRAEQPGAAYADGVGTISRLITPLPGVEVINAAPPFSAIGRVGRGSGSLRLSGAPAAPARFTLRIRTTGEPDVATFEYSVDGASFAYGGLASSSGVNLPMGTVVTFVRGTAPSFFAGDAFSFATPGSPIVEQGRDVESDAHLRARIAARWPALSEVALDDTYEQWAYAASAEVTKVIVQPVNTEATPGRVRIVIAGAVNPLLSAVPVVQAFISARRPIADDPLVEAARPLDVVAGGEVHVHSRDLARIQPAAQLAWQTHLNDLPIGGTVRVAELAEILMNLGAVDFVGLGVGVTGGSLSNVFVLDELAVARPHVDGLGDQLKWVLVQ